MVMDHDHNEEYTRSFLKRALENDVIQEKQHLFLTDCLKKIPDSSDSGLDPKFAGHFIHTTLQLIEVCLADRERPRSGFVNPIIQAELDQLCREKGGKSWTLSAVSDKERSGKDRQFTFGQVKQNPDDPEDPSFFGGVWTADCDGKSCRVAFAIVADVIPGSEEWHPLEKSEESMTKLDQQVRNRGPHPWKLQVEPDSHLGHWIAKLSGTTKIGQHAGHIPLGVLGEAVRRALEPRGLSHLLLGPSRRDPPTEPWHTGSFLRRIGDSFDFEWRGHAIENRRNAVVEAQCVIGVRGKILQIIGS
ncbi:hypothetical protein CBD41_00670 [bacterium TMED181]|nr:hypothetical protein [Planctomycetota bacterium]OUW47584.1 MAG: hypothetical protein CBD41_00670 [bacterium TMED181]